MMDKIWLVGGHRSMLTGNGFYFVKRESDTFSLNSIRPGTEHTGFRPYYAWDNYDVVRFPSGDVFGFLQEKK